MNRQDYDQRCVALAEEAGIDSGADAYFAQHRNRVYEWLVRFGLFDRPLGDVLDIGPFHTFTPFLLRDNARTMSVLEGDDPAADALVPVYQKNSIEVVMTDLNEHFGGVPGASRKLPYADASFDTIICWETMEHFSFNPVPFVRDLARIARKDAVVSVIVPDRASIYSVLRMYFGRAQERLIDGLVDTADYLSNGKHVFHGHHWREYTRRELQLLFEKAGFDIREAGSLQGFYAHQYSASYAPIRLVRRMLFKASPVFGTDAFVTATPRK
jgi:SAM-dependent methyltransferase